MATNGGNLLQRTRCQYFYDTAMPCNKREPGTGCGAREGLNRIHAILGWSEKCVATYPGDMANALYALDAVVRVRGAGGRERTIPIDEFHRLPGDTPERDTNLEHGELIEAIELPRSTFAKNSYYLKVRDRASYAFALVAVAAGLELERGTIRQARVVLGSVAHKPWRSREAEAALAGKSASEESFRQAAELALREAKPLAHNGYKVELGKRAIVRALMRASKLGGA
jgi:xanthine dehydrogenase YagS FAD-binding subunit